MVRATGNTGAKVGGEQGCVDEQGGEQWRCVAVAVVVAMAVMVVAGKDLQATESATAVAAAASVEVGEREYGGGGGGTLRLLWQRGACDPAGWQAHRSGWWWCGKTWCG